MTISTRSRINGRRMGTKRIAAFAAALTAALMLCSCGGGNSDPAGTAEPPVTDAAGEGLPEPGDDGILLPEIDISDLGDLETAPPASGDPADRQSDPISSDGTEPSESRGRRDPSPTATDGADMPGGEIPLPPDAAKDSADPSGGETSDAAQQGPSDAETTGDPLEEIVDIINGDETVEMPIDIFD